MYNFLNLLSKLIIYNNMDVIVAIFFNIGVRSVTLLFIKIFYYFIDLYEKLHKEEPKKEEPDVVFLLDV